MLLALLLKEEVNMKHQNFCTERVSDIPVYHFECTTFDSLGEKESVNTFRICTIEMPEDYSALDDPAAERYLRHSLKVPKNRKVISTGTVAACCNETGPLS